MSTKVLLGSSHRLLVDGLAEIIATMPQTEVVATAFSGEEVLMHLQQVDCQIAILDVHLAVLDGYTTARLMKQFYPQVRVILLAENHRSSLDKLVKTNVYGYLLKTDRREELDKAIQKAVAGHSFYGQVDLAGLAAQTMPLKGEKNDFFANSFSGELTKREVEIVTLVAQGHSSARIANILSISLQTVNTHRRNLIKKTGARSAVDLMKYAIHKGYIN